MNTPNPTPTPAPAPVPASGPATPAIPVIANLLPAKVRLAIYAVLSTAAAVNAVFAFIPSDLAGRIASVAAFLGFGLATANTPKGA